MTQSIGQRLYDLWIVPNEFAFEKLPERFQAKWNRAATELLRGILTGEIPLPDELMKSGYFVGQINPEAVANDDLESFEGTFQHHNPSVVL